MLILDRMRAPAPKLAAVLSLLPISLLPAREAAAADTRWAVLPARADVPPPRDPTLMRLSREVGEAIHGVAGKQVVLISRELRDDACPSFDGKCPRDVAAMINAEQVISLVLSEDYGALELRMYGAGPERSGSIPCKWSEGLVSCELAALGALFTPAEAKRAPAPAAPPAKIAAKAAKKPAIREQPSSSVKKKTVDRAMEKMKRRFDRCAREGWGELSSAGRPAEMSVQFRVDEHGRVVEVRLQPRGFDDVPAFACMARSMESLRFAAGDPGNEPFVYPLPLPAR